MWESYLLCPLSLEFIFCSLHTGADLARYEICPDVRLTPVFVIVHFLRWNIREKFKLLSDLKDFESWLILASEVSQTDLQCHLQHGRSTCSTCSTASRSYPPVIRCPQDLEKAYCRTAFDRSFVHSAIVKWYGSSLDERRHGDQP